MLEDRRVAVVVPAYDVEEWIQETLSTIPSFVDHVIVVDDASCDRTRELARAVGRNSRRVKVLSHAQNRGVGAAIRTGYLHAIELGSDAIAVMAGDGQMHPDDLLEVVRPVVRGSSDYVKGDRTRHPDVWRRMPPHRIVGTRLLAWLTRRASGIVRLNDSQCGYSAIARGALSSLDLERMWPRFGYCNDLLGELARRGLRVDEVVVRPVYRGERSGLRPWHAFGYAFVLGRMAVKRWASPEHPRIRSMRGVAQPVTGASVESLYGVPERPTSPARTRVDCVGSVESVVTPS